MCLVTKPPTEPRKLQRHTHQKKHENHNPKTTNTNDQTTNTTTNCRSPLHTTHNHDENTHIVQVVLATRCKVAQFLTKKKNDVAETRHVSGVRPKKKGCHALLRSVRRLWQLARVWRCTVVRRR